MTSQITPTKRPWIRLRALLAVSTVAVFLGAAVAAPMTIPGAEADGAAMQMDERLFQEFVPNADPIDDLVLPDVPLEKLPDPEPEPEPEPEVVAAPEQPAAPPRYTGGGSPAEWMAAAGIPEADWGYVDFIASKESGWNPNATNPSSGACGLIQALPCSKVPGSGYNPVDNLRWANGYASGRYGSWAEAYNFWTSNHWW